MPDLNLDPASPKFSVITVVRDDLIGLQVTLQSVDAQTSRDFECTIVDGASTDGTPAFLGTLHWPNLQWISEPDEGIYDAMNKGITLSNGRFLIFMNAGDRFAHPEVLDQVSYALTEHGEHDVVYGDAFQRAESGETFRKRARPVEAITYGMFTHHQAMFFARCLFPKFGYDKNWKIAGDYALIATAYKNRCKFLRVHFPICIFAEGGVSSRRQTLGRQEVLLVQKNILEVGVVKRSSNHVLQWASSKVRTYCRPIYNVLRYRA
jgi:putative colanic acid biosynthesis glycosyltransferase